MNMYAFTRTTGFLVIGIALVISACGDVGDAPEAQTGDAVPVATGQGLALPIDTARSEIKWRGAKVTRAHDGGFDLFSGTVFVANDEVANVDLTIEMPSIYSDTDRLTGHLQSGDFFEVETDPTASFQADQIVPTDSAGATHMITGNLTLRDQTNSVTFPANITKEGDAYHAVADFIIDRQRWGISYPGQPDDLIRDDVRIMFDIYAAPPSVTAPADSAMAAQQPVE